jgi:acetyl-CoA carboxylase carboxyl transferase subunit alpha
LLPARGVAAMAVDADDGVPAFRPLSFLSSIADRVGELAAGDGPGTFGPIPTPNGAISAPPPEGSPAGGIPAPGTTLPPASTEDVWARVQLARNLSRPHTLEFMDALADDFVELHGDRLFGDDEAVVAGLARIAGRRVVVIGQQKGADTDENIRRNFGMPHPEGYRKAMRVMELAERAGLPVVTFVDVPGAHPGPESEERGIAEAIARSIGLMTRLRTPIVAIITGEGGSGGALAIAVGDVVIALENAVYSVISPEGCASILWRTSDEAATAAAAMRMSAADQHALGVVDIVVDEPGEGAHAEPAETAKRLRSIIVDRLDALSELPVDTLLESRYRRYRALGAYTEAAQPEVPERVDRRLADRLRDLLDPARRGMAPVTESWSRDDPPAREEV